MLSPGPSLALRVGVRADAASVCATRSFGALEHAGSDLEHLAGPQQPRRHGPRPLQLRPGRFPRGGVLQGRPRRRDDPLHRPELGGRLHRESDGVPLPIGHGVRRPRTDQPLPADLAGARSDSRSGHPSELRPDIESGVRAVGGHPGPDQRRGVGGLFAPDAVSLARSCSPGLACAEARPESDLNRHIVEDSGLPRSLSIQSRRSTASPGLAGTAADREDAGSLWWSGRAGDSRVRPGPLGEPRAAESSPWGAGFPVSRGPRPGPRPGASAEIGASDGPARASL